MSFKEFVKESLEEMKEAQKPENVKKRLKNEIAIETLKAEREELRCKTDSMRKERLEKKFGGWAK